MNVDPEIRKALANIKRRQAEIDKRYGKSEDEGPLFGRRHGERKQRIERDVIEELFDDEYDQ
jgi:hypothetical protein